MSSQRRSFSPAFKAQVALQALRGEKSQAALCREHNLSPDLICRWKQTLEEQAQELFAHAGHSDAGAQRLAELERLVGQLTLELSAAKNSRFSCPGTPTKTGGDQDAGSRISGGDALRTARLPPQFLLL
jgi:transposase-like protein